jgi:hypothetical protein
MPSEFHAAKLTFFPITATKWRNHEAGLGTDEILESGVSAVLCTGNSSNLLRVRYWAESPDNGPDGWGFRFAVTFLFPK